MTGKDPVVRYLTIRIKPVTLCMHKHMFYHVQKFSISIWLIPHKWGPYGAHAGKEGSKRNVIIALPATAWDNETSFVKTEQ